MNKYNIFFITLPFILHGVENLTTQVDHYGERKRPYTVVHDDVSGRNRQTYDRLRTVNHPFGLGRITVVIRRVVYGEKRTSFTLKSMP